VHLPLREAVPPGGEALAELELPEPVVAAPGDRFVLRTENASDTLGGGTVIEVLTERLPARRVALATEMLARAARLDEPDALVEGALRGAGERGLREAEVCARTALLPEPVAAALKRLAAGGVVRRVGRTERWVLGAAFSDVAGRVEETVRRLHQKDAAVEALPLAQVRASLGRVEPSVLEDAIEGLVTQGRLVRTPAGDVRHASHASAMPRGAGQPPGTADLEGEIGLPRAQVLRTLHLLESRGLVFKADEFWFDARWIEAAKQKLKAHAAAHGGWSPADARTLLDSTRKWVIPLLEALDKAGFSRRQGDLRVVRQG
jgi:selenocysteine-specific elongation factor